MNVGHGGDSPSNESPVDESLMQFTQGPVHYVAVFLRFTGPSSNKGSVITSGLRFAPCMWSTVHWRRLTGVVELGISAWSIVHMLAVIPVVSSSRTVD